MTASSRLRVGFAGTPQFAATILEYLINQDLIPVVVYTQPDRPSGRGRKFLSSPVKQLAESRNIPVRQPKSLKSETVDVELDVLIVAAYGLLLPKHVLDAPRFGCINVHASLLPRWRGAAPVERAIMAGDQRSGATIMLMDEGLDTGPIFSSTEVAISPSMTGGELEALLAEVGARELAACLESLGSSTPEPQAGPATYADKLTAADATIDWTRPAVALGNQIRALTERMPASSKHDGLRIRILSAVAEPMPGNCKPERFLPGQIAQADKAGIVVVCGDGNVLTITELQLNRGKGKRMNAAAALNGYPELFKPGRYFGHPPDPGQG